MQLIRGKWLSRFFDSACRSLFDVIFAPRFLGLGGTGFSWLARGGGGGCGSRVSRQPGARGGGRRGRPGSTLLLVEVEVTSIVVVDDGGTGGVYISGGLLQKGRRHCGTPETHKGGGNGDGGGFLHERSTFVADNHLARDLPLSRARVVVGGVCVPSTTTTTTTVVIVYRGRNGSLLQYHQFVNCGLGGFSTTPIRPQRRHFIALLRLSSAGSLVSSWFDAVAFTPPFFICLV